jgi:hypothetical protein
MVGASNAPAPGAPTAQALIKLHFPAFTSSFHVRRPVLARVDGIG